MIGDLPERPGRMVAQVFREVPLRDHPALLAFCEQRARLLKDQDALSALKDYRALLPQLTLRPAND